MQGLYKLNKRDVPRAAAVLAKSFSDYPMFQYILGDRFSADSAKIFLRFLIKYSVLYGEAYAPSREMEGVLLFTEYDQSCFSFPRSLRAGALSLMRFGSEVAKRFHAFDAMTTRIHKACVPAPHIYLIMIGVHPDKQGQGLGSGLIRSLLDLAQAKGYPVYLETHGEDNVAIYQRFGFSVAAEATLPGTDIRQYAMLWQSSDEGRHVE